MTPGAAPSGSRALAPYAAVLAAVGLASVWILTRPAPVALLGDNEALRHPLLADAYRQLGAGHLPLWTTGRWGGSPLLGDPDLGALYPPYYLGYALTAFPHWRALDVSLCVHLGWLATGTVWLLSVLGLAPETALAGAALVTLNPVLALVARTWGEYWAALSWWPWLFGAAATLARGPTRGAGLLAAGALAAQVYAGYPQFALYSGVAALLWIVAHPGPERGRRAALAVLVGAAAVGLAAPQILPGLAMARDSVRLGPGGAEHVAALDGFALSAAAWTRLARATPISPVLPAKLAPGILMLALVAATERRFVPRFLAALTAATALLATGPGRAYHVLQALPPFGFFGGPIKYLYLGVFVVTVLAGLGLARVLAAPPGRCRLAVALLALAALPAATSVAPGATWLLVAGAVALVLVPARALGAAAIAAAVGGSAAFLLATRGATMPPMWGPGAFRPLLHAVPQRTPAAGSRALALVDDGRLRQPGTNFGALWGVESLNGLGALSSWRTFQVLEHPSRGSAALLVRQLGADPVIVIAGSALETELVGAGFDGPPPQGGLRWLSAAEAPPPRYALAPEARAASAEEAITAARAGTALTARSVLIEAPRLDAGEAGDPSGRLELLDATPGRARLRVDVERPTWLVARQPFSRGWTAAVDGRPAAIRPAGGFFLGLPVGAGAHEVTLAYRAPGLLAGTAIALLAALLLPALLGRLVPRPAGAFTPHAGPRRPAPASTTPPRPETAARHSG